MQYNRRVKKNILAYEDGLLGQYPE
jgi:hypothetical protein